MLRKESRGLHYTLDYPELLPQAVDAVRLHARVGTGYGIPQAGNLFVTPAGVAGNNASLKAQRTQRNSTQGAKGRKARPKPLGRSQKCSSLCNRSL